MNTTDERLDDLLNSFDAKKKPKPLRKQQASIVAAAPMPSGDATAQAPKTTRSGDTAQRRTIGLYAQDISALDRIIDGIKEVRGQRISLSEAVRIAIELCPDDLPRIGKAYDQTSKADQRRKHHGG